MKHTSMRGVPIDLTRYIAQNEDAVALGNAKMNARGDIVGPRGEVIKTREEVSQEYHKAPSGVVKHVPLRDISAEVFSSPADALAAIEKPENAPVKKAPSKRKISDEE